MRRESLVGKSNSAPIRFARVAARIAEPDARSLEKPTADTVADLIHRLGDVPVERILVRPFPATEEDIVRLLEGPNKRIVALIEGVLVEKAGGTREGLLANFVGCRIGNFADANDLGLVAGGDAPFRFRLNLVRFPDVSFISWDRIPGEEFPDDPIAGVIPDLAVEVLSPSNTRAEIELKLDHYFQAGVRLAWVIDTRKKTAEVYTSRNRSKKLGIGGELSGGKVLPGFRLPLHDVFGSLKRKKRKRG